MTCFGRKMVNYGHPMIAWAIEEGWTISKQTHDLDSQVLTNCSEVLPLNRYIRRSLASVINYFQSVCACKIWPKES